MLEEKTSDILENTMEHGIEIKMLGENLIPK